MLPNLESQTLKVVIDKGLEYFCLTLYKPGMCDNLVATGETKMSFLMSYDKNIQRH